MSSKQSCQLRNLTKLLINAVKKYPELYDPNHEGFRDLFLKNRIYEDIAKEIGCDMTRYSCKLKWKSLRDTYLKYLKGNLKNSNWQWKEKMKFLDPYLINTKKHPNEIKTLNEEEHVLETDEEEYQNDAEDLFSQTVNYSRPDPLHEETIFQPTNVMNSSASYDDIDLIFLGYAKTVKKLKKSRQIQTKFQIAQLIMKAELEELAENDITKRNM